MGLQGEARVQIEDPSAVHGPRCLDAVVEPRCVSVCAGRDGGNMAGVQPAVQHGNMPGVSGFENVCESN